MSDDNFVIVANPHAGPLSIDRKLSVLKTAADILGPGCKITGLDTKSLEELCSCAAHEAKIGKTIVIASGDSSFVAVAEAVKNAAGGDAVIGYLPLGTAIAMWYTISNPLWPNPSEIFNIRKPLEKAAKMIKAGKVHGLDIISCGSERKALVATIGFETEVIMRYEQLIRENIRPKGTREERYNAYAKAVLYALSAYKRPESATVKADDKEYLVKNPLTIIVSKLPYYGFGLKVMPNARISDGKLHSILFSSNTAGVAAAVAMSYSAIGNSLGKYVASKTISVKTSSDVYFQADGTLIGGKRSSFEFKVLPGEIKLRY
jgi:diacylglycerol kinase family enzyme